MMENINFPFLLPGLCCVPSSQNSSGQLSEEHLDDSIADSWKIIHAHIAKSAPDIVSRIQTGASPEYIASYEKTVDMTFSEDMREWYAHCNGLTKKDFGSYYLQDGWEWYSLEIAYEQWQWLPEYHEIQGTRFDAAMKRKIDSRIQPIVWHARWMPFMQHFDQSLICIDLAPTEEGVVGQIILIRHMSMLYYQASDFENHAQIVWLAPSLQSFAARFAQDLVQNKYAYDASDSMLWSQEGYDYIMKNALLKENWVLQRWHMAEKESHMRHWM